MSSDASPGHEPRGRGGGRGGRRDRSGRRQNRAPKLTMPPPEPKEDAPAPSAQPQDQVAKGVGAKGTGAKGAGAVAAVVREPWSAYRHLAHPDAREAMEAESLDEAERASNLEAQADERTAIEAIYEGELRVISAGVLELSILPDVGDACAMLPLPSSLETLAAAAGLSADGDGLVHLVTLPPITLRLRLPAAYPSRAAPVFGLRCSWLSDEQLEALCVGLDRLCSDSPNAPVVCECVEWIRSEAVAQLPPGTLHPIRLPSADAADAASSADAAPSLEALRLRGARWPRTDSEVASAILIHVAERARVVWRESLHACGICLEQKAATDCTRFFRCNHTFCKECTRGYMESLMEQGAATAICCPEVGCRLQLTPPEVQSLLPADLYTKYEAMTLQTSLDAMADVVWCPRCEYPAFLADGEGGQLACCGECGFAFCVECRLAWHGLAPCANLATRWRNADESGRDALRAKYGARVLEEVESAEWVLENTKRCPNCTTTTEKNGGCNHITCAKCSFEWCWLCGCKYVDGHFKNGACEQFSLDFFTEMDDFW